MQRWCFVLDLLYMVMLSIKLSKLFYGHEKSKTHIELNLYLWTLIWPTCISLKKPNNKFVNTYNSYIYNKKTGIYNYSLTWRPNSLMIYVLSLSSLHIRYLMTNWKIYSLRMLVADCYLPSIKPNILEINWLSLTILQSRQSFTY